MLRDFVGSDFRFSNYLWVSEPKNKNFEIKGPRDSTTIKIWKSEEILETPWFYKKSLHCDTWLSESLLRHHTLPAFLNLNGMLKNLTEGALEILFVGIDEYSCTLSHFSIVNNFSQLFSSFIYPFFICWIYHENNGLKFLLIYHYDKKYSEISLALDINLCSGIEVSPVWSETCFAANVPEG